MRHAIHLPPFGPLADPGALIEIAVAADETGWDGLFLWDHILSSVDDESNISDVWTMFGAIAARTRHIRLGPMVTPLPRRRVANLARQSVTLDRLSGGRLTFGVGSGSNRNGEFTKLGEESDSRTRAAMLDEGLEVLLDLWKGGSVTHEGAHLHLTGVTMTPTAVQEPRIPIWLGVTGTAGRPLRRAARYEGVALTDIGGDDTARVVAALTELVPSMVDFDVAVPTHPRGLAIDQLESLGATWALHAFWPGHRPDQVLRHIGAGPPR